MMKHCLKTLLNCCVLSLLLLGLWGCSTAPSVDRAILAANPDWQILTSEAVQLEIPPNYVGGEPEQELAAMQATLTAWGFGDRTEWLAQNAEKIELLAFQKDGTTLNSINVVAEDRPADLSAADYLQQQMEQLQAAGLDTELRENAQGSHLQINANDLALILYVYPTPETFWVITYSSSTPNPQFTELVERSQQSFQVLSETT